MPVTVKLSKNCYEKLGDDVRQRAGGDVLEAKIDSSVSAAKAGLVRWMFVFWAGSVLTTLGGVAGLALLLRR